MKDQLTHLDAKGRAQMVDIGAKPISTRFAKAQGMVSMAAETFALLQRGDAKKGDVLAVAKLAGIMAAKRTAELIPLCHSIPLSHISLDLRLVEGEASAVCIVAEAQTTAATGVEMEALTAVGVAALTIYDMLKAVDRAICIREIRLLEKSGGLSGDYRADPGNATAQSQETTDES
ncbi:MAG: cyclic pyranopterin monophosphate synthase MoaC [Chloroflexi bacterium]|nr:cyclic pyranopterin monophosphate synthase MoaC [Chloroflexota bacterium]